MEFENVFGVINRMLFQDVKDLVSLGGNTVRRTDPPVPRSRLVQKALLSRVIILLAMAASCAIFPNHNPGDDVFQFALQHHNTNCFCLKGQACEDVKNASSVSHVCADTEERIPPNLIVESTYNFLLAPLTRWDASRFLNLAIHPLARDPVQLLKGEHPECADNSSNKSEVCEALFVSSEQAHAFFPLLPLIIRTMANFMVRYLPRRFLPSTYQAVVVLAALLWNTVCFVVAALALYDLTLIFTQKQLSQMAVKERKIPRNYAPRMAYRVFLLFCVNPASVFFTSAYSEATFAMLNFLGHALFMRAGPWTSGLMLPLWMAASYTRSNGSINAAWLLLKGLGDAVGRRQNYASATIHMLRHVLMAMAVLYPIYWHDATGFHRHCSAVDDEMIMPSWCDGSQGNSFSLYGYVQRKHWDVGIFRYYTLMKIPNFLLAAPILSISLLAVVDWIQISCRRYLQSGKEGKSLPNVVEWAISSLAATASTTASNNKNMSQNDNLKLQTDESVLLGPLLLGHYAVLAAVCVVGILVAHVEIITRMICSSCPAIYWYMALCSGATKEPEKAASAFSSLRYGLKGLILPYCLLYIVLGVAMHPNWLPWT